MDRLRRAVWLLIVVADAGILLWGSMAALAQALTEWCAQKHVARSL